MNDSAQAGLAHSPEWFLLIQRAYGHSPLYLRADDGNGRSGVLPAFVVRRPFFGAVVTSARLLVRTPLVRLCALGPPLGVALFVALSPYAEVRFILPSLLLMFACAGVLEIGRAHV